jgi:hypothetical protein
MLVEPVCASVTLTSNLAAVPQAQLEIVVASVDPGFCPQRGRDQDPSRVGHLPEVSRVCAEAFQ